MTPYFINIHNHPPMGLLKLVVGSFYLYFIYLLPYFLILQLSLYSLRLLSPGEVLDSPLTLNLKFNGGSENYKTFPTIVSRLQVDCFLLHKPIKSAVTSPVSHSLSLS
ncbi:hypothetical protein L9F63_023012, partial [Diploptera punctata]